MKVGRAIPGPPASRREHPIWCRLFGHDWVAVGRVECGVRLCTQCHELVKPPSCPVDYQFLKVDESVPGLVVTATAEVVMPALIDELTLPMEAARRGVLA